MPPVGKPAFVERRMSRFLRSPLSTRAAASVIVSTYATVVLIGGLLMRLFDREEYPNIGRALWWALQTVTTVGYGDVTPENRSGRIVATLVMLQGIAFLTITIAVITSTFVARAQRERAEREYGPGGELAVVKERLDDLAQWLERIEVALAKLTER